jgi:hypothetical protein
MFGFYRLLPQKSGERFLTLRKYQKEQSGQEGNRRWNTDEWVQESVEWCWQLRSGGEAQWQETLAWCHIASSVAPLNAPSAPGNAAQGHENAARQGFGLGWAGNWCFSACQSLSFE